MDEYVVLYLRVDNQDAGVYPTCRVAVEHQDVIQRVMQFGLAITSPREARYLGLDKALEYLLDLAKRDQRVCRMKVAILTDHADLVKEVDESGQDSDSPSLSTCLERIKAVRKEYAGFELVWVDPVLVDWAVQSAAV